MSDGPPFAITPVETTCPDCDETHLAEGIFCRCGADEPVFAVFLIETMVTPVCPACGAQAAVGTTRRPRTHGRHR